MYHLPPHNYISGPINKMSASRREPLRISGEHGSLAYVVQSQVEHADPLQADAPSSMRWTAVPEGVHVRLDGVQRYGREREKRIQVII